MNEVGEAVEQAVGGFYETWHAPINIAHTLPTINGLRYWPARMATAVIPHRTASDGARDPAQNCNVQQADKPAMATIEISLDA